MELIGHFLVFFVVYGTLQYVFSERKRRTRNGDLQTRKQALIRTISTAAIAGVLFVLFFEVLELF